MADKYECKKCGKEYKVPNYRKRETTAMAIHRKKCFPETLCADECWIYKGRFFDAEIKSLNLVGMESE